MVVVVGWMVLVKWMGDRVGVGGKVGRGFDGGCRGGWCASEGWGDGVLDGGLLLEKKFSKELWVLGGWLEVSWGGCWWGWWLEDSWGGWVCDGVGGWRFHGVGGCVMVWVVVGQVVRGFMGWVGVWWCK